MAAQQELLLAAPVSPGLLRINARCAGALQNPHRGRNSLPWISPHDALRRSSSAAEGLAFPYTTAQAGEPARPIFRHLKPDISRGGYVRSSGFTLHRPDRI